MCRRSITRSHLALYVADSTPYTLLTIMRDNYTTGAKTISERRHTPAQLASIVNTVSDSTTVSRTYTSTTR